MQPHAGCLLALAWNPCTGSGFQPVYMLSLLQPNFTGTVVLLAHANLDTTAHAGILQCGMAILRRGRATLHMVQLCCHAV